MFSATREKIGVLSNVTYDDSRIIDVYHIRQSENLRNSSNHGNNHEKEDTKASDSNSRRVFVYEFFFIADLKKALEKEYLALDFKIKSKNDDFSTSMFTNVTARNPVSITAAIFSGQAQNKKVMALSKRDNIVYREKIDLTSYISNYKMGTRASSIDSYMFGNSKSAVMVNASDQEKMGKNLLLAQILSSDIDLNNISRQPFIDSYNNCIRKGVDPSSQMYGNEKQNTPLYGKGGAISPVHTKRSKLIKDLSDSMKVDITDQHIQDPKNISELSDKTEPAVVVGQKSNRFRLIRVEAHLEETKLLAGDKCLVVVSAISPKSKLVGQSITISVDHQKNLSDFYSISSIPDLFVTHDRKNNSVTMSVLNDDPNVGSVDVYSRVIYSTNQKGYAGYELLVQKMKTNISKKVNFRIPDGGVAIFRAIPNLKNKRYCDNFSTYTISRGSYNPDFATILTSKMEDGHGCRVSISGLPDNVAGVSILRRNISESRTGKFKKLTTELFNATVGEINPDSNQLALDRSVLLTMFSSFVFNDFTIDNDSVYEYKCTIHKKDGTSSTSSRSSIFKHIDRMNLVNVSTTTPSISRSSNATIGNSSTGYVGNIGKAISISFDVEVNIKQTDADILRSLVASAGLEEYLESSVDQLSSQIQSLVSLNIKRTDLTNGEVEDLGNHQPGSITDDGFTTIASAPTVGGAYLYEIMPCLVSAQDVALEIVQKSIDTVTGFSSLKQVRNPAMLTMARASSTVRKDLDLGTESPSSAFQMRKVKKFIDVPALIRGTISSEQYMQDEQKTTSILSKNPTGDSYSVKVDTSNSSDIGIKPISVTFSGLYHTKITWKITGTGNTSIPMINHTDYFIVSTKKQGVESVIGCAHGGTQKKKLFSYIDLQNDNFVGKITYYVTPVYLNGSRGAKKQVGSIVKPEFNSKKFRRG